ncbi:MAG: tRNA (guanosine(37)-N1)-methyltransferase TrmD [Deltaproteobacteria bacterium]|nr:tRNA (guanosine(37)-N1)-methyltransferase TrmD [Deltaproteobacteria bacterium]
MLGLFPDLFKDYFSSSLLGKAQAAGLLDFKYHQLRDWSLGKNQHHAVDDRPYGGGSGMVMLPEVICAAVRDLKKQHQIEHVVMTTPAGHPLNPKRARDLSQKKNLLFLCGRYEGIDQRAVDLVVDEEISIGDYVISGGELAATVVIDAVARFVPGVIRNDDATVEESHEAGLLEYPHYTRPEEFENIPVPEVLLSGHHGKIADWRRQESLRRTWLRRPDLLKQADLSEDDRRFLAELIHKKKIEN